ncbi:MAG TPA: ABC transporter permease [Methylibium sp.]|uniref:ABC transporter permease n=1 Tax=Methylibium sp. TaxID=2067992 RepID=UPI002DC04D1A|nr:ABC transporter permease [Methylibium sp.]HEU4460526.1 ABC transporter permease [Methylibium sp.]
MVQRWRSAGLFALQGLGTARERASLALLGIVVGVAAVVALISIGKSVERQALAEFDAMGTQVVHVRVWQGPGFEHLGAPVARAPPKPHVPLRPLLALHDVLALPEVELGSELMPVLCEPAAAGGRQGGSATPVVAVRPDMQHILGVKVARGRFLHDLDKKALWVVLGHEVDRQLQAAGVATQPGAALSFCGTTFHVAGVLSAAGNSETTVPVRIDASIFVSVSAAARLPQFDREQSFAMRVRPDVSPPAFARTLEDRLRQEGRQVQTTTSQKIIELRRRQAATYTRFLTALSSISLFVGGLGILNIMLVAVVERRREIGIRLAVGAEDTDIVLQFLMESTLLSMAGGALGIVVGLLAAAGAAWLTQLPFVLSAGSIASALAISLVIGVSAGVYPALRASREDPVDALQGA